MGLIVGYDLCEDYVRISYEYSEDQIHPAQDLSFVEGSQIESLAFLLCKRRGKEEWLIGEAAMEEALLGRGILIDQMKELVCSRGSTILEGTCYTGIFLLKLFFQKTLGYVMEKGGDAHLDILAFTIPKMESEWIRGILDCTDLLGIPRETVKIISHSDSFLYYLLNQSKSLWSGACGLFDITKAGFWYYEIQVRRDCHPVTVETFHRALPESFDLDLLKTKSGGKMADSILLSGAEKMMKNRRMSAVFLTGEGMAHCQEWAFAFLRYVCSRRKVFYHHNLFARGALFMIHRMLDPSSGFPFICVGEGRVPYEITMDVVQFGVRKTILLNRAGTNWHEAANRVSFFPDGESVVRLEARRMGEKKVVPLVLPLDGFPKRPPRTTRVELEMKFTSETELSVVLRDRGFGELFPETDCRVEKVFTLQ